MTGLVDGNNFFVSCERVFDRRLVGRPVAVLSNNDGCCVSRSNEFKALGIPMGTPYFELRGREFAGELVFRSSNYELYADMSRRVMSILRADALNVEQYSIDEAFIVPPVHAGVEGQPSAARLAEYGSTLRAKILRWTGIPCGIGFAPTKTLAKIANHIGKHRAGGVYVLPDDPTEILDRLPAGEVWGVGRRLQTRLRAKRIFTARALRDSPEDVLRSVGGTTLLKTAYELRGEACIDERDYDADPGSISCSRSFGKPVSTIEGIEESLASYASQAAEKLRRYSMLAAGCVIYAQTFLPDGGGDFSERTVMFPEPTDATNEMLSAIRREIAPLFTEGILYRKTGVVFFGLEKAGSARQMDLFSTTPAAVASPLYRTIDSLNARYGRGMVFSAAEGIGNCSWRARREKVSRRVTTRWDELLVVR